MEERGTLGGPEASPLVSSAEGAELDRAAALGGNVKGTLVIPSDNAVLGSPSAMPENAISLESAAIKDLGTAVGPAFDRSGMISYKVQQGDNLSRIASYFGISISTIIGANPGVKANSLNNEPVNPDKKPIGA